MRPWGMWLLLALVVTTAVRANSARAQDEGALEVPPPPGAEDGPPASTPAPGQPPSALPPSAATASPSGPRPSTAAPPSVVAAPSAQVVAPLLTAAELDMTAGRYALALARSALVSQTLPENTPLRIRSDGLHLLARQRIGGDANTPPVEQVLTPLVVQAELDVRTGRPLDALPRLDFALARLPAGPLRQRAMQLRQVALSAVSGPTGAPPMVYGGVAPPPVAPPAQAQPEAAPRDPDRRGTGEAVELYITAGLLGGLTGGYIPFVASNETAGSVTYTLSLIGGAGLFTAGVISLDLSGALRTGVAPTISASIRFGFANGMLSWGLAAAQGNYDPVTAFTLVWGGSVIGALTGLGVGFGLQPRVHEERFVESIGIWGGALGTSIAMLTEYEDPTLGLALTMVGLDAGILAGVIATAAGAQMSARRTLFIDLGFLAGFGVGSLVPLFYFLASREVPNAPAFGAGSLIGSVAGWILLFLVTDGMDDATEPVPVHVGVAPVDGGGMLTISGAL